MPNGQQVCLRGAATTTCATPPGRYVIQGAAYDSSGDVAGANNWVRILANPSCASNAG